MVDQQPCASRPVPVLISLAFAQVTTDILLSLNEEGFGDLRLTHFLNVIRHMSGAGDRPARLARLAGVTPQAISLTLSELEKMGYVRREADPDDQRSQLVFWAERGLRAGAALERHFARTEERWAAAVGQESLESARVLLAAIAGGRDAEAPR